MLRLVTLGRLAVTHEGAAANVTTQRSRLLLLAVLAVAGSQGIRRERLQALLWPDADTEHARKALNQALFALRRDLGAPDLVLGADELRLNSDVVVVDLHAFEAALAARDFERAVDAYGGAFLEGTALRTSAETEQWIERERVRLQAAWQGALMQAASAARTCGDLSNAVRHWKQLAASDPLNPTIAVGMMQALAEAGDHSAAVAHARVFEVFVRQELDAEAAPEVMALARSLEAQRNTASIASLVDVMPGTQRASPEPAPHEGITGLGGSPGQPHVRWWRARAVLGSLLLALTTIAVGWWRIDHPAVPPVVSTTSSATPSAIGLDEPRVAVFVERTNKDAARNYGPTFLIDVITRRLKESAIAAVIALPDTPSTDALLAAREVGARLLITSRSLIPGGQLTVTVWDPIKREQLWTAELGHGSPDSLAERAAAAVAVRLDPRMAQWIAHSSQPTSLDSYQEFARGFSAYVDLQHAAGDHFAAAARDTAFTMALVMQAWAQCYIDSGRVSALIVRRLRARRLAPLDNAMTEHLTKVLSHDLGAEYEASIAVAAAAPRSEWRYLQAESAMQLGRAAETVQLLEAIHPDVGWLNNFSFFWGLEARALHLLGRHERELAVTTEARSRFPTNRIVLQWQLKAYAALGRITAVDSTIEYALTLRQKENWLDVQPMQQTVAELDAHGYHDAASRVARRTLAWVKTQPAARQAEWATDIPTFLYHADSLLAARRALERVLVVDSNEANLALLAVICAELGDKDTARQIGVRLGRPVASPLLADRLVLRAWVAASLDEREAAVAMLRDAFRAGYSWRSLLHINPGMKHLRGYPPYEALIHPVE